jgi:hypothetical protein
MQAYLISPLQPVLRWQSPVHITSMHCRRARIVQQHTRVARLKHTSSCSSGSGAPQGHCRARTTKQLHLALTGPGIGYIGTILMRLQQTVAVDGAGSSKQLCVHGHAACCPCLHRAINEGMHAHAAEWACVACVQSCNNVASTCLMLSMLE